MTGANGQIGSELTPALRERYGAGNVIATDIVELHSSLREAGPWALVDVTSREALEDVVARYRIDVVYHMAAILSASGEKNPNLAWNINTNGLRNVLEVARERKLSRVFCPSSIAVFGPQTPREGTPQETILRPTTMYGITKVAGELLCSYYVQHFGLDVRGIRYPGIISSETPPGGGTTDYAVEVFYAAVRRQRYVCFVREDTVLPMMYLPDCVRATIMLMEAGFSRLQHHVGYNVVGLSFSAGELVDGIKRHMPSFVCQYRPDFRQRIADSWPRTIDDSAARAEWDWRPRYDLATMTADMLDKLGEKHTQGRL